MCPLYILAYNGILTLSVQQFAKGYATFQHWQKAPNDLASLEYSHTFAILLINSHILAVLKAARVGATLDTAAWASYHIRQRETWNGTAVGQILLWMSTFLNVWPSCHVCYCLQGVALSAQVSLLPSYTLHFCLNIRGVGGCEVLWRHA